MSPMTAPTAGAQVLEGFASTTAIHSNRCKFRGFAFGILRGRVPLLFRHDETQVAGEIEELSYDQWGNLQIRARVDHEQARRCCAFSVAGRVLEYELRDVDTPNFHAVITDATLSEISLTDRPSNAAALVTSRYPASPHAAFYDQMQRYVGAMKQLVALLPAAVMAATATAAPAAPPTPSRVRPRTSFGQLADALNDRLEA